MVKVNKIIALLLIAFCLMGNCHLAFAVDELWIVDNLVFSPTNCGLATDSETNVIKAYNGWDDGVEEPYMRIVKISGESGMELWWANYEEGAFTYVRDVDVDSSDNIIVVGDSDGDWVILKYDSDGTLLWETIDDLGSDYDLAYGVAVDVNDEIIVSGKSDSSCITRRYDDDGFYVDTVTYSGVDAIPHDVTIDNDGNVIVAGRLGLTEPDYFIVKYDSLLDEDWSRTYHRYGTDIAYGVAADEEGNVYVTGYSEFDHESPSPFFGYLTRKYDSSGNFLWTKAYDNKAWSSHAYGMDIDQYGRIYVTGESDGEILTIRYSPDGKESLVKRYSFGASHGVGKEVEVDANGDLIVLGYVTATDRLYTMKYVLPSDAEGIDVEDRLEELEEEVDDVKTLFDTLTAIIDSILNWIESLPIGLRRLYNGVNE